jgi:hypothetical protein
MGTDIEPVPVTGLLENFSPMPRMAPPPLGSEIVGAADGAELPAEGADSLSAETPCGWLSTGI